MFNFSDLATDRRGLLAGGAAAALLPAAARAAPVPGGGFTHGVASGEPGPDAVLLWTRYAAASPTMLRAEIARDKAFAHIVAHGEASADPANDCCAKVTLNGLAPGQWYHYRFTAPDGSRSPAGRTRTLPAGPAAKFTVAVFSCSNIGFGWFNAYGHAAARDDIDLVVHVGDYLYEYAPGHYPTPEQTVLGRVVVPAAELVHVDQYRQRYASYRADPDLQALHRKYPVVAVWDDHEFANDAWLHGAQNHDPKTQGDWEARKAAARQAYHDWMPVSGKPYQRYDIGDLVSLITLDTRIEGRDRQLDMRAAVKDAPDQAAALAAFRDGPWSDASRTLLGAGQEAWANAQLADSVARGVRWQLLAQQIVMGNLLMPPAALTWLKPDPPKYVVAYVGGGVDAGRAGMPGNMDSWGGYAPARARLLRGAQAAGANLVVVSGDSHNAWAFDLAQDGKPAGVEFAGQGVTSPGFESELGVDPKIAAAGLVAFNPELKWCDTSRKGYLAVTFTPAAARSVWVLLDDVRTRNLRTAGVAAATVAHGTNRMVAG